MRFHSFQLHPKELERLTEAFGRYNPGHLYKFNQIDLGVLDIAKKYLRRYYTDLDETNLQYATLARGLHKRPQLRTPCHTIVFYVEPSASFQPGYACALHGHFSYALDHAKHALVVNIPMSSPSQA
jgi:hypothetical protein